MFSGIEVPPGILLFEDPPLHDLHCRLLSRVFTPRRMLAVEELVRGFCDRELDPLRDADGFDFVRDLGALAVWRGEPSHESSLVWQRRDGRRSLVIGATADHIVGLPPDESRALLDEALDWATQSISQAIGA